MNFHFSSWPIGLAVLALGLGGCSSSPISRIDANRALYESWPLEIQSAVLEGNVVKGMKPEMVEMALGKPSRVEGRAGSTATDEVWIYARSGGSSPALSPNVSLGGSLGGVGVSTGGRRSSSSSGRNVGGAQDQQVVFQSGVVVRVD